MKSPVWLRLRLSRLPLLVGTGALVLAAQAALGVSSIQPRSTSLVSYQESVIAPLALAVLVAMTCRSPLRDAERGSALILWPWGLVSLVVVPVAVAVTGLAILAVEGNGSAGLASIRAALGFEGIALLVACAADVRVSWIGPLLWVIIPPFIYFQPSDDKVGVLTFFIQPLGNATSWVWALGVWGAGVVGAVLLRGDGLASRMAGR